MSKKPADEENHPYGHGKIEPLSATVVSLFLFGAAIFIAVTASIKFPNLILLLKRSH